MNTIVCYQCLTFGHNVYHNLIQCFQPGLSGKYQGGISQAVFPGKYRPVQYPQSGKYREILGNTNNLLVFCVRRIFNGVLRPKYPTILPIYSIYFSKPGLEA